MPGYSCLASSLGSDDQRRPLAAGWPLRLGPGQDRSQNNPESPGDGREGEGTSLRLLLARPRAQWSRSPCAVGPAVARAAVQDLSAADSSTGAQHYKLSESSSKGSASSDKWADSASSTGGGLDGLDPTSSALWGIPHPATAALPSAQSEGAPRSRGPSSVASAEPGWEVLIGDKAKKRKGQAHSVAA